MRWQLMDWMVDGSSDEAAVDWPQLVHASSWSLVVACGWLGWRRPMTKPRTLELWRPGGAATAAHC